MDGSIVAEHALKHGLLEDDIRYAWSNFVRMQHRGVPNEGEVVAVGYDQKGGFVQMVAAERPFGIVIYHAMKPPTMKVLVELGLVRR